MGHRANFVIISNGEAKAFHDQFAALGCTFEFAEGPSHATRSAEAHGPTDELLDWAFAEAGYLIDHDKKVAIVFGYPEFDCIDFEIEEIPISLKEVPKEEIESGRAILNALKNGAENSFKKERSVAWLGVELG